MRVAVISDTHIPSRAAALPTACLERLREADLILHTGDVSDAATLAVLGSLGAPLVAVRGNVEEPKVRRRLAEAEEVDAAGLRIGLIHDAGPEAGRPARLRRRFPGADLVVFGHRHIPLLDRGHDGFAIMNPGSTTDRRRQPRCSMAEIELDEAGAYEIRFLAVDDPAGPLPPELVRGASRRGGGRRP
jgi:hypothetical protein